MTFSNEPTHIDDARMDQLVPVEAAIEKLGLPPRRFRKLKGIMGVLQMQIEDGGDSPVVNQLLLDALRAGIRHQVGEQGGAAALQAI